VACPNGLVDLSQLAFRYGNECTMAAARSILLKKTGS